MKKNTKIIIVVVIVVILSIVLFCSLCGGIFFSLIKGVGDEGGEIKAELFNSICTNEGTLSQAEYTKYFTHDYIDGNTYEETLETFQHIFKDDFNCDNLLSGSFIDMIQNGESLSVSWELDQATAVYTLPSPTKEEYYTFYLEQVDGGWEINGISITSQQF